MYPGKSIIKMRKRGQSIPEYVVLFTVITLAVTSMQLYFRRSIQAVVKIAADQIDTQKHGAATFDPALEYIVRDTTLSNATSFATTREQEFAGAAVTRIANETSRQEGGISLVITREKE